MHSNKATQNEHANKHDNTTIEGHQENQHEIEYTSTDSNHKHVTQHKGEMIDRSQAQGLFNRMHPSSEFNSDYLSGVTNQAILSRMLNNLRIIRMKARASKDLIPKHVVNYQWEGL